MNGIHLTDDAFSAYGHIISGIPAAELESAMLALPMPAKGFVYQPREDTLHALLGFAGWGTRLLADMPYQLGYCLGENERCSVLARHGGSTFVYGLTAFDLLLASRAKGPAGSVRCTIPSGTFVELYGDTLRSAPLGRDMRILVIQPYATNTEFSASSLSDGEVTARNTWTYIVKE